MLKKLLIAAAILASTSTLALASVGAPYVGVGLGLNNTNTKLTNSDGSKIDGFGARSGLLNVFGGYGATVNQNLYLGGEAFISAANTDARSTDTDEGSQVDFRTKYSYGVSFIPGWLMTDHTMVYGRLGVVKTRFESKATAPGLTATSRKTLTGGQIGLGMQTDLTQNVALRGEYDYTRYRSANMLGVSTKPSTDQFTVGLVYKFD